MRIVLGTKNKGKKKEAGKILKDIDIVTVSELNDNVFEVIEDGKTFRQNAIKKALTYSRYTDELVLAEDSGLAVEALEGRPGVRSSRFARVKATDKENIKKLLGLMKNIPEKNRGAEFICVAAIAKKGNLIGTVEGKCAGKLGLVPKGSNGFGYDPIFYPKGYKHTFAQLEESVKNKISHRARALTKAKSIIQKHLK